jgi:transglutaminase-like putative cysteine protease
MKTLPEERERIMGWTLAGLAALHVLALHPMGASVPPGEIRQADPPGLTALAILLTGAALRGLRVRAPRWLGYLLLPIGLVAAGLGWGYAGADASITAFLGALAILAAAIHLLGPITPWRGQRVVFYLILGLAATAMNPATDVGPTLTALDVAAMYLLLEEAFRPADVRINFWVSLARSSRVIVPVVLAVLTLFWVFPSFFNSASGSGSVTGFAGGDTIDARAIEDLAQSSRVAFTARFSPDDPAPAATRLYWRGQVLEANDGFQWSVADRRPPRGDRAAGPASSAPSAPSAPSVLTPPGLPMAAPARNGTETSPSAGVTRYAQEIVENRGLLPLLDHAISAEARSNGKPIAVISHGAGTLSSGGVGSIALEVASSAEPLNDAPDPAIQDGDRQVPPAIRESTAIQEVVHRVLPPGADVPSRLQTLSRYLRESGFRYTTQPGPTPDLAQFLTTQRAGFCSHYAMAAASLLRLAGVPARVVTGYRGGDWNPWLHTITVRDSDAHAWVEAWDEEDHGWRRFDPTDSVAPELRDAIASGMDPGTWPWYRRVPSYAGYLATTAATTLSQSLDRLVSGDVRGLALIALVPALPMAGLLLGLRARRGRRPVNTRERMARLLLRLEERAAEGSHARRPGETPLAWLGRLAGATTAPEEQTALRKIATAYESGMYQPDPPSETNTLRRDVHRLLALWRV